MPFFKKSKQVMMDGKGFTFTPGKEGSLIENNPVKKSSGFESLDRPYVKKAKFLINPELKKNRMNIYKSLTTGASRG